MGLPRRVGFEDLVGLGLRPHGRGNDIPTLLACEWMD